MKKALRAFAILVAAFVIPACESEWTGENERVQVKVVNHFGPDIVPGDPNPDYTVDIYIWCGETSLTKLSGGTYDGETKKYVPEEWTFYVPAGQLMEAHTTPDRASTQIASHTAEGGETWTITGSP